MFLLIESCLQVIQVGGGGVEGVENNEAIFSKKMHRISRAVGMQNWGHLHHLHFSLSSCLDQSPLFSKRSVSRPLKT